MKKQKKILLIILIIIVILILAIASIFFINKSLTGNIIKKQNNPNIIDTYMHTKAICNESNFCQDNEIICQGNEIVSITPITGAVIQQSEDWEDPRNQEDVNKLC